MGSSSADLGRERADCGMPAAVLECLAAMRIGAETAFELEFVAGGEGDSRPVHGSEERE